jgi:hypothetical protein
MDMFTGWDLARMTLELTLGICIKLFCDHGRIEFRDLVNDVRFWNPQPSDEVFWKKPAARPAEIGHDGALPAK